MSIENPNVAELNLKKKPLNKGEKSEIVLSLFRVAIKSQIDEINQRIQAIMEEQLAKVVKPYLAQYAKVKKDLAGYTNINPDLASDAVIQSVCVLDATFADSEASKVKLSFDSVNRFYALDYKQRQEITKHLSLHDDAMVHRLLSVNRVFDVSKVKAPESICLLFKIPICFNCDGYRIKIDNADSELHSAIREIHNDHFEIIKDSLDIAATLYGAVNSCKRAEDVYMIFPDSLPYLPKTAVKVDSVGALVASDDVNKINSLLKKAKAA